jgi:tetratricopeptide (TPR) repeat protein
LISPLIPAEDFARQLTLDEVATLANAAAVTGRPVICSVATMGLALARSELGEQRAASLLRELLLFVRRNLRGVDGVALSDDELVLLLDQSALPSVAAAERLVGAVRSHVFTSAGVEHPRRMSIAIGVAHAPDHGTTFSSLLTAARAARASVTSDGAARAFTPHTQDLDLSRFVGRTESLAQLTDHLDDMVRGVGRVVAIVGERGVGKSALVRTLVPEVRLRGGSLIVATSREPTFVTPYSLWIEVLRAIRRLPVKSTRTWKELHQLDPTLEGSASGAAGGGSKTHLHEELADYLRLVAQQRPLVLLLENLQWADPASWDALEYLIPQMESERILFALTLQADAEGDAREQWDRLAERPRHSEIHLSHLTRDDVKRWLEIAIHLPEVGRDLLAYVYRYTEGNPLVLLHLLRDLEESGYLVFDGQSWHSSPVVELPPQTSLDELLARRLSRLSADDRAIVDAAALIAREAEAAMLAEVTELAPKGVSLALDRLLLRGLLVPTYDRGQPAFGLSGDEVARAARQRIPEARTQELHGRIARALAKRGHGSSAEAAWHFERGGNRNEAYKYALRAADEALGVHETVAAAELLASAEKNAPGDEQLADVRVRMAELAEMSGRYEEAEFLCDRALAWAEVYGDAVKSLRLKRMLVRLRMQRGQAARDTLEALFALEAEARAVGADAERAAILLLISQTHWRLGDLRGAQRVAAECVKIAERGSDEILIADSCNRLAVTIQLENGVRARELFNRSLEIATAAGDAFRRVRVLNNIGVLELISNNWDESKRMLTMAAEQARTARLLDHWGRAELNLGVLAGRMGDNDGAQRAFAEALRLTSQVQNSEEQLYATYNLAHLDRERVRLREAADTYGLVVELAERIGQVEVQVGALSGEGLCRFLMGNVDGARESYARAHPMMDHLPEWFQGRELLEALAIHLALTDGRRAEAVAAFNRALAAAGPIDVYGAAWLTAEFGEIFHDELTEEVRKAVRLYAQRPEALGNPRMRERLNVLKVDS